MYTLDIDHEDMDWLIDAARSHPGGMGHVISALNDARYPSASTPGPLTQLTFHLGEDKHGREHTIVVELSRGVDGCPGVRLISGCSGMSFQATSGNEAFVTTLRPDTMPPKE